MIPRRGRGLSASFRSGDARKPTPHGANNDDGEDDDQDDQQGHHASATTGYCSARKPRPTTNRSSPMLRIQFENGSGLALAAARVLVFVR